MRSLFKFLFKLLKPKNLLLAGLSVLLANKLFSGNGEQPPKEKGSLGKMLDSVKQFAGKTFDKLKDFAGNIFKKDEPVQSMPSETAREQPAVIREGIREPAGISKQSAYKIPQEIRGVSLNETEQAQLKDGKAVFVSGVTGNDGQKISCWARMNEKAGRMEYFRENPENPNRILPRSALQENKTRHGVENPKPEKSKSYFNRLRMQV
jgi:hypothetical protein